ncbi:MAG: MFS transporter [Opitutaceae bacterium]|nr:MFS transporter [Opitutaceae bacterium]
MSHSVPLLTKTETRSSLHWFNWNISLRSVFDTICGGPTMVFVAFALAIGIPRNMMGYFSAVLSVACIAQLLCLPLANRVRRRKRFILLLAVTEPVLVLLAILAAPTLPEAHRPLILGAAVFLAASCLHLTRPFADDWLATTIPSGLRGRYIGRRIRFISFAIIAATLVVGLAVDAIGTNNIAGLTTLLVTGAAFGIAAALSLSRVTMHEAVASPRYQVREFWSALQNHAFRRLLLGTLIFTLPFFFAVAYYQVFNLEVLHMRPWLIATMGVGYLLVKLLLTPWLGVLCDRIGPWRMLWIAGPVYAVFFLCFPFTDVGRAWPIMIAWAFVAVADGIYGVAAPASLYATVPVDGARPAYFALYNLVSLGAYAIGGLIAVPLLGWLAGIDWALGPAKLGGYHLFYALCGVTMIFCTLAVFLFPKSRRTNSLYD